MSMETQLKIPYFSNLITRLGRSSLQSLELFFQLKQITTRLKSSNPAGNQS